MMKPTRNRLVDWRDPIKLGYVLGILTSVVLSIAAYRMLGEFVRIRWSIGVHYGPEYAPALVVLGAFPVAVASLYVGCTWLGRHLKRSDEFEDIQRYYEIAVFGLVTFLVGMQALLIGANLLG